MLSHVETLLSTLSPEMSTGIVLHQCLVTPLSVAPWVGQRVRDDVDL